MFCLLFLLSYLANPILSHDSQRVCGIPTGGKIIYANTDSDDPHTITKRQSSGSPLRVHIRYMPGIRTRTDFQKLKDVYIKPAVQFWSSALSPRNPSRTKVYLSRDCTHNNYYIMNQQNSVDIHCIDSCKSVSKCLTADIPEEYLDKCSVYSNGQVYETTGAGNGVSNTDFVLFVEASQDHYCDTLGFLAYATTCQWEKTLDRPVAGMIQLCTGNLFTGHYDKHEIRNTIIHELSHALGFAPESFAYLRDQNGNPRTTRKAITNQPNLGYNNNKFKASENTVKTIHRWWVSTKGAFYNYVESFTLPTVLDFARKHFNCPTLEGVDLENGGGSGTAATHFETRVAYGDIMTGVVSALQVVSNLTLAYFYDSGWYNVNFSMAKPWHWGKNLGCDFVTRSCYEYMLIKKSRNQSIYPWCDIPNEQTCLPNRNAYGTCDLSWRNRAVADKYQYFTQLPNVDSQYVPYYSSNDYLSDYCPTYKPQKSSATNSHASLCFDPANQKLIDSIGNPYLQSFGKSTVCIKHEENVEWTSTLGTTVPYPHNFKASCHKYRCSPQNGLLLVFNKKRIRCPVRGGVVKINLNDKNSGTKVTGSGICPPCSKLCKKCPRNSASRSQRNRAR